MVEALQASVWCLHELRLEWTVDAAAPKPLPTSKPPVSGASAPRDSSPRVVLSPAVSPPAQAAERQAACSGGAEPTPPAAKRLVTLQQRMQIAKVRVGVMVRK